MTWLKAYEWERQKWPWHRGIQIAYAMRSPLCHELAKLFDIKLYHVSLNKRDAGGRAGNGVIYLGRQGVDCSLGTIFHEVAHLHAQQKHDCWGHRGMFKKSLIKVYCEMDRQTLKRTLLKAKAVVDRNRAENLAATKRAMNQAQKIADLKAKTKALLSSREYKIKHLAERIKKLNTKIKRLTTIRNSALRSLKAYERSEQLSSVKEKVDGMV